MIMFTVYRINHQSIVVLRSHKIHKGFAATFTRPTAKKNNESTLTFHYYK